MLVVFVHRRDVVVAVLIVFKHAFDAVLNNHRQLVAVARIVTFTVRYRAGQNKAVTVLVLQALTV